MKINLISLVPETFGNRKFFVKEISGKLEIASKRLTPYGKNPKPIILPRQIELSEEVAEAIGIYAGDGKLTPNDIMHVDLVSMDTDIVNSFLRLLKILNVKTDNLYLEIIYRNGKPKDLAKKWSEATGISSKQFRLKKSLRHRHDVFHIQLGSVIFRIIFEKMIFHSLPIIKADENLRRAFLRGYFAADGTIAFNGKENYINYVGFSYDAGNESWLRNFCMECLELEGVPSKFNEKEREGEITITGWDSYCKLWRIDFFNCCERKQRRFSKILESRRIYCKLNDDFRKEFFSSIRMKQKEIAKSISSWQGNVSRTMKGKHLLTIKQLKILQPYSRFDISKIIENVEHIRFGPLSKGIINSKTEISSMFEV